MVANFTTALFSLVLKVSAWLMSALTYPLLRLAQGFIPDMSGLLISFNSYINDHLIPGIAFAREVFFNVTHFPRSLFYALILIYYSKLVFHISIIPIKFIFNTFRLLQGAPGEGEVETKPHN